MNKRNIYILTAEIHEGKTSTLLNWTKKRNDVYGILSPKVDEQRVFQNIETGEEFDMEAREQEKNILEIGRFKFSQHAFDKAVEIIRNASTKEKGWLVIDEIGPLELHQKGFHDVLTEILFNNTVVLNLLLVVRKPMLANVLKFYSLEINQVTILELNASFFKA